MKLLNNEGYFEVLTKPDDVINTIAMVARTCYQSQEFASETKNVKLVQNLIEREHFAMFEFSHLIVRFNSVSRGFTHEMVRHRLASFAQESTRYVDEKDFRCVIPPHINYENQLVDIAGATDIEKWLDMNEKMYRGLRDLGWLPEDARQFLPTAIEAQIVVGANIREWMWIFQKRCDISAHWEIRKVMLDLLRWCKQNIPLIFDNFFFFKTKDGKEYARLVRTPKQLTSDISDFINSRGKEELLTILTKLGVMNELG